MDALRRPLHQSWLLAGLSCGVVIGVFVSFRFGLTGMASLPWLLSGGVLAAIGLWRRRRWAVVLVLLAGACFGLWRAGHYQIGLAPYTSLIGTTLTVRGVVTDDSDVGKRGEIVLRLGEIEVAGQSLAGSIWVSSAGKAVVKRGDIVTLRGTLDEGFGSFAASMYRAEFVRIEHPTPGSAALRMRDWFAGGVRQAVAEPEASLGIGYVVGQRRALPEELDAALRATGLTHIVVASGYNLTILVGAARRLFVKKSKFLAAFFSGGMTIGFVAVTGMSPSMSRAGLVTGLGLLAWYYGRKFHPIILLSIAAAITLLLNPSYGQNDLGWQLSFASFTGVLVVGPLLQRYFYGRTDPGVVRQIFFETVCAWLCTVPLIVMAFGQFSNVAVLANLLVLPLVPLAMLLTFFAGVTALVAPPLAAIAGLPASIVLGYMTKVALYLGNVSWAQTEIVVTPLAAATYYVVLASVCVYAWQKTGFRFIEPPSTDEHEVYKWYNKENTD